jgi:hypothetical protein
MNLKKLERYLRVNLLGPGPRLIKKNLPGRGLTKFEKHWSITIGLYPKLDLWNVNKLHYKKTEVNGSCRNNYKDPSKTSAGQASIARENLSVTYDL